VAGIVREVREKLSRVRSRSQQVDYLTFVPDGEPTIDSRLGEEISALRVFRTPIAVISNASLLWRQDVRDDLAQADWVSLKCDAVDEHVWRTVNRPSKRLRMEDVLAGARAFASRFHGTLVTETMLVAGVNDNAEVLHAIGAHLHALQPTVAYLAVPTRPPCESWVRKPTEAVLNQAYHVLAEYVPRVEYLNVYEGSSFRSSGDFVDDLLGIVSVHPMRDDAVEEMVAHAGVDPTVVERLVAQGELLRVEYEGRTFFVRSMRRTGRRQQRPVHAVSSAAAGR
jgi:wyosine [tRNA(Phe)-imidazoG37] synthetase (radical SAM superfamily)